MALRRVFVDVVADGVAQASGDRAHHLARVVRLREGDQVEVSDLATAWVATVASISGKQVRFTLHDQLPAPTPAPVLDLYLAVIKFPRLEWAIEKATEIGVRSIIPVASEYSDGGLIKAAPKKLDRWRKIVEEAAQQARRLASPHIEQPIPLADALARPADARYWVEFGGAPVPPAAVAPAVTALYVGPEGGWAPAETEQAIQAGAAPVSLGPNVLRAETAALVAAALLQVRSA